MAKTNPKILLSNGVYRQLISFQLDLIEAQAPKKRFGSYLCVKQVFTDRFVNIFPM